MIMNLITVSKIRKKLKNLLTQKETFEKLFRPYKEDLKILNIWFNQLKK